MVEYMKGKLLRKFGGKRKPKPGFPVVKKYLKGVFSILESPIDFMSIPEEELVNIWNTLVMENRGCNLTVFAFLREAKTINNKRRILSDWQKNPRRFKRLQQRALYLAIPEKTRKWKESQKKWLAMKDELTKDATGVICTTDFMTRSLGRKANIYSTRKKSKYGI